MIKLTKAPEPSILQMNGTAWLRAIEEKLSAGQVPTDSEKSRYRHAEIKATLIVETHGKCAYCESRLLHVSFGDVEHITPKSHKLIDIFRWENLTLACDVCNTYKRDAIGIIDPYIDEPAEHFKFIGPMVYPFPQKSRGVITAKKLRLNRPELIENRSKRLEAISNILLTIHAVADQDLRAVLIQDLLLNEASDQGEYAAFVRSFISVVVPHIAAPEQMAGLQSIDTDDQSALR